MEIVLRDGRERVVARLCFRVCPACRTGRIHDIWVDEARHRQGLGREALHPLLALHPGHRWSTTLQSRQGRAFFSAMARETSTGFPAAAPLCSHLRGRFGQFVHRVTGRSPAP
ncbi:GNAT family N-acetyltransferase [Streptomyces phaeochromogenes]|uniref:GNAT family N-acetyltransferase n=1 Tax=Streptomyces phaeochromogenes TaxID=1923 RepID=UPI00386A3679|nr:N-acetyltransferase [Streptomyces phaeochromogenes]